MPSVTISQPSRPLKDKGAHEKGLVQSFPVTRDHESVPALPPKLPPKPPKAPYPSPLASPTSFDTEGPPRPISAVFRGPNLFEVVSTMKGKVNRWGKILHRGSLSGDHFKEEELLTSASRAPLYLLLKLVSGSDLPVGDVYSSDPFVMIYVGNKYVGKTRTIMKSLNPVWDESFEIPLLHMNTTLQLKVFDEVSATYLPTYLPTG